MALNDLTPQLRTRLNRVERAVGWFVFLAAALLVFGFAYYIYHTAERKGWFVIKAKFFTYVQSSSGLTVGDPVVMMGFPVGQITLIQAMPPGDLRNVRVEFEVRDRYFRYIWTGGSHVKVNAAGFLNQRQLEVLRATNGYALCVTQPISILELAKAREMAAKSPGHWQLAQEILDAQSNVVFHAFENVESVLDQSNATLHAQCRFESNSIYVYDNTVNRKRIVASWHRRTHRYENFTASSDDVRLRAAEDPPVTDQIKDMVSQVQTALPGFLALTNKIAAVLDNSARLTSNLNTVAVNVQPVIRNVSGLTAQLRGTGALGNWLLNSNMNQHLESSLGSVDSTLAGVNTNLPVTLDGINRALENLAGITGSLHAQVDANTNLLTNISKSIVDTDELVQGLKRHWLLRSAFKTPKTNAAPMAVRH